MASIAVNEWCFWCRTGDYEGTQSCTVRSGDSGCGSRQCVLVILFWNESSVRRKSLCFFFHYGYGMHDYEYSPLALDYDFLPPYSLFVLSPCVLLCVWLAGCILVPVLLVHFVSANGSFWCFVSFCFRCGNMQWKEALGNTSLREKEWLSSSRSGLKNGASSPPFGTRWELDDFLLTAASLFSCGIVRLFVCSEATSWRSDQSHLENVLWRTLLQWPSRHSLSSNFAS